MRYKILAKQYFFAILSFLMLFLLLISNTCLFLMADILPKDGKNFYGLWKWISSDNNNDIKWLLFAVLAISILNLWLDIRNNRKNKDISSLIIKNHKVLVEDLISDMAKRLDFNSKERITVYSKVKDCFVLRGRYSESPTLKVVGSRGGIYHSKNSKDCISVAWEVGKACDKNMSSNIEKWINHQDTKWGMCKNISNDINMKSRSIVAIRISYNRKHAGVIVFESLQPNKARIDDIRSNCYNEMEQALYYLLHALDEAGIDDQIIMNNKKGF